jgi:phosphoribosylanthranilate isomerase
MSGEVADEKIVRCTNNACVVDAGGLTELNVDGLIKLKCVRSVLSM